MGIGTWWGDGEQLHLVLHTRLRKEVSSSTDCQNVEGTLREMAENSVPELRIEEFAVSLLHRKTVSRMPCRHSLFFLSVPKMAILVLSNWTSKREEN
jgi:hypothetical protein